MKQVNIVSCNPQCYGRNQDLGKTGEQSPSAPAHHSSNA